MNWILYPSDPRQLENELPQYILAHSLLTGLLIQLRYGSISKMMLMSYKLGERGDVELFMTTVRFGLTLWASAHAVDYVRLGNDLCQFWHCASPAMKELYAKEIFTRLNANGNPIATDLAQEESVKHVRSYLGKVYRRGHDIKMEAACTQIVDRPAQASIHQELRQGTSQKRASRSNVLACH